MTDEDYLDDNPGFCQELCSKIYGDGCDAYLESELNPRCTIFGFKDLSESLCLYSDGTFEATGDCAYGNEVAVGTFAQGAEDDGSDIVGTVKYSRFEGKCNVKVRVSDVPYGDSDFEDGAKKNAGMSLCVDEFGAGKSFSDFYNHAFYRDYVSHETCGKNGVIAWCMCRSGTTRVRNHGIMVRLPAFLRDSFRIVLKSMTI